MTVSVTQAGFNRDSLYASLFVFSHYCSLIKLFADIWEHFTHGVVLTVNPDEWLEMSDDGSAMLGGILLLLLYTEIKNYVQANMEAFGKHWDIFFIWPIFLPLPLSFSLK